MTSLFDIVGNSSAGDDAEDAGSAGSDGGGMIEVDATSEDGAFSFFCARAAGAAGDDDDGAASTPARASGPTCDGGVPVIEVDDTSEEGAFSFFCARADPASPTPRARGIGVDSSAAAAGSGATDGGDAPATPRSDGDPAQNVDAESDTNTFSYSAEALRVALNNIRMEGTNLEDLESVVKQTCAKHGVKLARESSRREKGSGSRLVMVAWKCVHGMRNRQTDLQAERRRSAPGCHRVPRQASSQRTGCGFKITGRWPLKCLVNKHPRLTTMVLEHGHEVDKAAMDVQDQMRAPLSSPMKAEAAKLTDAGLAPAVQAKVLEALHDRRVNTKAVQNAASQRSGGENLYDAQELLEKVRESTKSGGVSKVKLDRRGRFSHLFWMTAGQVALAARYGAVLLYDDTAVKNRYRLPLGLGVVIDGEYYTRIVFQTITADTTRETFEWMLEAFQEARGAPPDVFIQDADIAMTSAAEAVFPFATKRRCIWHLGQNITKNLGGVLGSSFPAFRDMFYKVRGRLNKSGFEEDFTELLQFLEAFPKAEKYMMQLYHDRERWAVAFSPLSFCVASWTTNRVEGMNSQVRRICNARTSLVKVFGFLEHAIEQQSDRSALRNAQLHIPMMTLPRTGMFWFGDELLKPLQFGLGVWPLKFMQEEMDAASLFCSSPDNCLVDGPDRAKALGRLEYVGDMVIDVETVAVIVESRNGVDMRYVVLAMKGGSHLCSCRTLQTLGLCCRHFWMAMSLSRAFKFHVGILHKHWLSEQGCIPMDDWPLASRPKWSVALRHKGSGAEGGEAIVDDPTPPGEGRWKTIAEGETINSTLVRMKEHGPTVQDRRKLYVDLLKKSTAIVAKGVDTVDPETLRHMFATFEAQVEQAARIGSGTGVVVGNPDTVRLPAGKRLGSKRHKSSVEARYSAAGTRKASQSYN